MEQSDVNTRRRMTKDLLEVFVTNYITQVTTANIPKLEEI